MGPYLFLSDDLMVGHGLNDDLSFHQIFEHFCKVSTVTSKDLSTKKGDSASQKRGYQPNVDAIQRKLEIKSRHLTCKNEVLYQYPTNTGI